MLNNSYYLRELQTRKETPIAMKMVLGGKQLKYSTNERIRPGNILKHYQLKEVVTSLKEKGVIKDD
jgi:hypothetical protein